MAQLLDEPLGFVGADRSEIGQDLLRPADDGMHRRTVEVFRELADFAEATAEVLEVGGISRLPEHDGCGEVFHQSLDVAFLHRGTFAGIEHQVVLLSASPGIS